MQLGSIDFMFGLPALIFMQVHGSRRFLRLGSTVGGGKIASDSSAAEIHGGGPPQPGPSSILTPPPATLTTQTPTFASN